MAFVTELGPKVLQSVWKHKRPWRGKAILRKKNEAGGIRLPDFRLTYKSIVIKTEGTSAESQMDLSYRVKD